MQDTEDVDSLADQVDALITSVRRGTLTAAEVECEVLDLLEAALDGDQDADQDEGELVAFVDYTLGLMLELSDDPRVGRATMHDTVRTHLDRLMARSAAGDRLDDRVAAIRIGLTFDCDAEHLELITLCREGRALDPVLYADPSRAAQLVGLAAEFEVLAALEAAVSGAEDPWRRLGAHFDAWVTAFDALATIAWNPASGRREGARRSLVDLLAHPHTALDAAVRIQPSWLAGDDIHQALTALDRLDALIEAQPASDPSQDSRLGAIRHAVTSLIWLARDAERSAEVHRLWAHR